jgi:hypothetical protein
MFERYTEKARRVIFFARYEASEFGSPVIDTEHLLLGILRDDARIRRMLPAGAPETIRAQIDARFEIREKVSASVDLPLSNASKRVLAYGAEEAERLKHRHIGSEHLFLGLLREKGCLAAELLEPFGVKLEEVRKQVEVMGVLSSRDRGPVTTPRLIVTIHGLPFKLDDVLGEVRRCRLHKWHWRKTSWKPQDCVIEKQSGKISLDMTLAADSANFEVVKDGWKKDRCTICSWELFESEDDHGTGYTNGRDWLCLECFERFWQRPDFISGSYSDIT